MMPWKRFRLELAPSPEFPAGSASRAYVVDVPVNGDGVIDQAMLQAGPQRARIQRQWPNEADISGHLVHTDQGWSMSSRADGEPDARTFGFADDALRVGEYATVTEPDGRRQRYRIIDFG